MRLRIVHAEGQTNIDIIAKTLPDQLILRQMWLQGVFVASYAQEKDCDTIEIGIREPGRDDVSLEYLPRN